MSGELRKHFIQVPTSGQWFPGLLHDTDLPQYHSEKDSVGQQVGWLAEHSSRPSLQEHFYIKYLVK